MAEIYRNSSESTKPVLLGQEPNVENNQNTQVEEITGNAEIDAYLASLPLDERVSAYKRITAPLDGKGLIDKVKQSGYEYVPSIEEFDRIYEHNKQQETFTLEGASALAEGIGTIMGEVTDAVGSSFQGDFDSKKILPTVIEAGAQGTHRTIGMFTQSDNPDGILFGLKDVLTGSGTRESRYGQYLEALRHKRELEKLHKGETSIVFDKKLTNPEWVKAGSLVLDPMMATGFLGKALGLTSLAGKAMQATGLAYAGEIIGESAVMVRNGILGGSLKLAGNSVEFLGGAVRNTVDYGIAKAGNALEATTGLSAKEFNVGLRGAGIGTTVADIAGHGVPYGSGIAEVYVGSAGARGIGEAVGAIGDTVLRQKKWGRGVNSWAQEALETTSGLSDQAKSILKVINAVDPMFTYSNTVLEGASHGAVFGGALGYLDNKTEGFYAGVGAGIALGGTGAFAGKIVGDIVGNTGKLRRSIQANMVMEGLKEVNPNKHFALEALRFATEAKKGDMDFVNSVIIGLDKFAPNVDINALTPIQFDIIARKMGYNPETGRIIENSLLKGNLSDLNDVGNRKSTRIEKANAISILRDNGFNYAGDRNGFLDALKTRDSYKDIARRFEQLPDIHKEVVLRQIEAHTDLINSKAFTKTEIREHYNNIQWAERFTDIVNDFHNDGVNPAGVKKAKDTISQIFRDETKNGKLTTRGELLKDKLRNEGYLDKNGNILEIKDSHNFELTNTEFKSAEGIIIEKGRDGRTQMWLNLNNMQKETFAHELFHGAMRQSIHAREFIDRFTSALHGKYDKMGKLVSRPEVNEKETMKFLEKYLSARYSENGILSPKYISELESIRVALAENKKGVRNNIDAWKTLEHYSEEFGAYYFSEWLRGKNRNYLFRGGELTGIEGLVERAKEGWLDYWQSKFNDANPSIDFSEANGGIAGAFVRSGKLGRIKTFDLMMQDFVRATSNSNKNNAFNPSALSQDALGSLIKNSGVRGVASIDPRTGKIVVLDKAKADAENAKAGKAAYNILSTLDPKLRTTFIDGEGNITGRLSVSEFDALVRAGIVEQSWVDKHQQLYAIIDGTESNVVSFGYLGKSEQITDASYPRNYGKDVTFKNRQAIVLDVVTKIGKDGKFYTVFETLDKKVVSGRQNNLWSNAECRALWEDNRTLMESDFFKYLENASKSSKDPTRIPSASILDKGDGLGGRRRDFLHQMLGIAKTDSEPYTNRPIAEIPEGIRHSVTSFNVDRVVGSIRVDNSQRINYNHKNAFKDLSHNWSPADTTVEKTGAGDILTHPSGYKFIENKDGSYKAFDRNGQMVGTYATKEKAISASEQDYKKSYSDNTVNQLNEKWQKEQSNLSKSFAPALTKSEIAEAKEKGSVFEVERVKEFIGKSKLVKQTRDEFIIQQFEELSNNPDLFEQVAQQALARYEYVKSKIRYIHLELDELGANIKTKQNLINDTFSKYSDTVNENERTIIESKIRKLGSENIIAKNKQYQLEQDLRILEKEHQYNGAQFVNTYERITKNIKGLIDLEDIGYKNHKTYLEHAKEEMSAWKTSGQFKYALPEHINQMLGWIYDESFKTGSPVTVVAGHGTKSVSFATNMLYDAKHLGANFSMHTSNMGAWFAGMQDTFLSGTYAGDRIISEPNKPFYSATLGVKALLKFDNPFVINWDSGYKEQLMSETIAKAKINGHDGVIWKRIRDGGTSIDTHYFVFNDKISDNILPIESTIKKNPTGSKELNTEIERTTESLPRGEGVKNGRELGLYLSPAKETGGRIYSEDDFSGNFIGKVARDNPHLTRRLNVSVMYNKDSEYATKSMFVNLLNNHGQEIANMTIHINPETNVAKVYASDVQQNYRGMGYGKLLYSEAFERLRSMGIKNVKGEMADREGRPAIIRKSVAGSTSVSTSGLLNTKLSKNKYYSPSEEGKRVYSDKDFSGEFIGKFANSNPKLVSDLNIDFNKNEVEITTQDGRRVGSISGVMSKDGKKITDLEASVSYEYRGKGYGKLLYSEFLERMRNLGVTIVHGEVSNSQGIPIKIRNEVAGKGNTTLLSEPQYRGEGALPATISNFKALREQATPSDGQRSVPVFTRLERGKWYSPIKEQGMASNETDVTHWIKGFNDGTIKFVKDFSDLNVGGAMMIGHMPDTAKVGDVVYGDKVIARMQGGLMYAIVNGEKMWASNFSNEKGGDLVRLVNEHLKKNNGVAYVLLTRPAPSKIFAAVDGTKGLVNVFHTISEEGIIPKAQFRDLLIKSASEFSDMRGYEKKPVKEVVERVLDLINNQGNDIGTFGKRASFAKSLIDNVVDTKIFESANKEKQLEKVLGYKLNNSFVKDHAGDIIGRLFEEEFLRDVPEGHSYGVIKVTAPLVEVPDSGHRGYTGSVKQSTGKHQVILFNETHNVTELVNKGLDKFNKKQGRNMFGESIKMSDPTISRQIVDKVTGQKTKELIHQGEGEFKSYVGSNIPYQELIAKKSLQLSRHNWKSEKTENGEIHTSDLGYKIIQQKSGSFKVYNKNNEPTGGIFGTTSQAKFAVDKLELTKR